MTGARAIPRLFFVGCHAFDVFQANIFFEQDWVSRDIPPVSAMEIGNIDDPEVDPRGMTLDEGDNLLGECSQDQTFGRSSPGRFGCVVLILAIVPVLIVFRHGSSAFSFGSVEDSVELLESDEQQNICRLLSIGTITYKQWMKRSFKGEELQQGDGEVITVDDEFLEEAVVETTVETQLVLHDYDSESCGNSGNLCWVSQDPENKIGLFIFDVTDDTPSKYLSDDGYSVAADKYWCVSSWLGLTDFATIALEDMGGLEEQPACLVTALYQDMLKSPDELSDQAWMASRVTLHRDHLWRAVRATQFVPHTGEDAFLTCKGEKLPMKPPPQRTTVNNNMIASGGSIIQSGGTGNQAQVKDCEGSGNGADHAVTGSVCCKTDQGYVCCAATAADEFEASTSASCPQGRKRKISRL